MANLTAELISDSRAEALREAVSIAKREASRIMRLANKAHEQNRYDLYETLESEACVASRVADKIAARAKASTGFPRRR